MCPCVGVNCGLSQVEWASLLIGRFLDFGDLSLIIQFECNM